MYGLISNTSGIYEEIQYPSCGAYTIQLTNYQITGSTLNIKGGKVSSDYGCAIVNTFGSTVNISGGAIDSDSYNTIYNIANGVVNVSGDSILNSDSGKIAVSNGGGIFLATGGIFSNDVTSILEENYKVVELSDGTYKVADK